MSTPNRITDFDSMKLISHPLLPNKRQFVVYGEKYGKGIWSETEGKIILPNNLEHNGLKFRAEEPKIPTSRIFWEVVDTYGNNVKFLYMAKSSLECSSIVEIPSGYYYSWLLTENILYIKSEDSNNPSRYVLWNIDTNNSITLDLDEEQAGTLYMKIDAKEKKISMTFGSDNNAINFIIDCTNFTVKQIALK